MNENRPLHDEEPYFCFFKKEDLAEHLGALRKGRYEIGKRVKPDPRVRLTRADRKEILEKTKSRCHICCGMIDPTVHWEADHVDKYSLGGGNELDNYLAAHGLCNTLCWNLLPKEVQWILKIGVWARMQMEGKSELGEEMLNAFFEYARKTEGRRKVYKQAGQAAG